MIIKLYREDRIERDYLFYGSAYTYNIWIFQIRLNPLKILKYTNGKCFSARFQKELRNASYTNKEEKNDTRNKRLFI